MDDRLGVKALLDLEERGLLTSSESKQIASKRDRLERSLAKR